MHHRPRRDDSAMTAYRHYTATSLDGFLADAQDSLHWLLSQPLEENNLLDYDRCVEGVGVVVMGRTTCDWIVEHLDVAGDGAWPYVQATVVPAHRPLDPVVPPIRARAGTPVSLRAELEELAGVKEVWIVGGGDLAAQCAAGGMLDLIDVSIAPVLLGSGRPLFTAVLDLELLEMGKNAGFVGARHRVRGAGSWSA